jgi:hypothetical protein
LRVIQDCSQSTTTDVYLGQVYDDTSLPAAPSAPGCLMQINAPGSTNKLQSTSLAFGYGTAFDARGRSPEARSGSLSNVRRRSRGSLPWLHLFGCHLRPTCNARLPSLAWRSANELTPRRYLAPAKQCDSSSSRRRRGSHDDASSGDVDDDSTRLAQ